MNHNKVYLIQTSDSRHNVYKIGGSNQTGIKRIMSYGKETRIIMVFECPEDYKTLEELIKVYFRSKFKLVRGSEYFEGNELEIKLEFLSVIMIYLSQSIKPVLTEAKPTTIETDEHTTIEAEPTTIETDEPATIEAEHTTETDGKKKVGRPRLLPDVEDETDEQRKARQNREAVQKFRERERIKKGNTGPKRMVKKQLKEGETVEDYDRRLHAERMKRYREKNNKNEQTTNTNLER